jgi:5-methylcytosine-specific restriction endonuclease McrA
MAQPSLKAEFFVRPDGICLAKARPLKERERWDYFEASDKVCTCCGEPITRLGVRVSPFMRETHGQIDHIFPRSRGGQNDPDNLRLLCATCNASKGAK